MEPTYKIRFDEKTNQWVATAQYPGYTFFGFGSTPIQALRDTHVKKDLLQQEVEEG